ncbi:phosphatase PAP2 family protein [Lacibacterium aquatile]|uniref:Phosphatase PAP2 family protein n=1 Tax=Lacibacterium aquatile TaxID=1168082 RepID=A0ABW5DUP7_9PROT
MKLSWFAALVVATFLLFYFFPGIDLWFAGLGYTPGQGFALGKTAPFEPLHDAVNWIVGLIVIGAMAGWFLKKLSTKAAAFLVLSVIIGPVVLANATFKDNWGRARPNQIVEFGGTKTFTPVAIPSDQCQRNCSFVSGDAAGGFAYLAPALLAPLAWRRRAVVAGLAVGAIFGANRILQGGHFLSDVLFAGYVVGGSIWLLHWIYFGDGRAARLRAWITQEMSSHWGRWRLAATLFVPLAVTSFFFWDQEIARSMRGQPKPVLKTFGVITQLGDGLGWFVGSILLLVICLWFGFRSRDHEVAARWRVRAWAPGFFLAGIAAAGLVNSLLKFLFGRARPKLFFRDEVYGFAFFRHVPDWVSMPSGHTAMALAVATALTCLWPRWRWVILPIGFLVALSRVVVTAHWLGDILIGSLVGSGMVLVIRHIFMANGIQVGPGFGATGVWQRQSSISKGLGLVRRPTNK